MTAAGSPTKLQNCHNMGDHLALVLDDVGILGDLCGTNDQNLRALEQVLDVPVYTHGNEIFLASGDPSKRSIFTQVVGRLRKHVEAGDPPSPDTVRAIHKSLVQGSRPEQLTDNRVVIPNGLRKVFPRGPNQARYLEALAAHDIVVGVGPAGTGKTYLAVADALRSVLTRQKRKLIVTRPVVEAGESLGFLPGALEQKIHPYLRPLYDAMEALVPQETIRRLESTRALEVAPLAYMRGRTLSDAAIILDEAQNTTREQMKMFLTRIGEGSRAVITGDVTQVDLPRRAESGLLEIMSLLAPIPEISFVYFDRGDVVRHKLVARIVQAYESQSPHQTPPRGGTPS